MPNDKDFELDDLEAFSFDDLSLEEAPDASEASPGEDPFGVWVKSAPEDVTPGEPAEGLGDEDFLSSKELADLDESFDFVTVDEPLEGEAPLDDDVAFLDTVATLDDDAAAPAFDEISLDDFVSFDDEVSPTAAPAEAVIEGDAGDEIEEFLDIDIDVDDDIRDEDLEIVEGAAPADDEILADNSFSAEEVDLSEFGDFEEVDSMTEDLLAGEDDLPEVKDLPPFEEEPSLDALPTLDDLPSFDDLPPLETPAAAAPEFLEEEGFFEEAVLEEDTPPMDLEPSDENDLEHIRALEETLTGGLAEARPEAAPAAPASADADLAALILGKLEQELSSIKNEISELKKEMTNLKPAPVLAPTPAPAPAAAPVAPEVAEIEWVPETDEPPTVKESHGFFDEEDDETIALTGDELDNLLSTAQISEGEEAGVSLDEDLLPLDAEPEEIHVSDDEFLAGTSLDLNQPEDFAPLGVPESIELEDEEIVLDDETEDLLAGDAFDIDPLPEGVLEGQPLTLEIPEDVGLELAEAAPLAPDLDAEVDTMSFDSLPPLEDLEALAATDPEGWSLPPEPPVEMGSVADLSEGPLPPPPAPAAPSTGGLSAGLKDELRAVLSYMDKLLASLPDDKIQEFAESEHFEVYKKLFEELGLIE